MLDDRKSAILRAVVEEYIKTAQPVGSAHVSRSAELAVSPATIRNEMAVLEREGYLAQPHTSAGRVPTDKGYRFFVDQLVPLDRLDPFQDRRIGEFFDQAHGELERMLHDTSELLATLTDCAAVVVGPPHEIATIRSVQLVELASHTALVVAVLSNGVVEKRALDLEGDVDADRLAAVGALLAAALVGCTLTDAGAQEVRPSGDRATDALARQAQLAVAAHDHDEPDRVFVGGASRMAVAFDAVETVRQILVTLEQQFVVVSLLREVVSRGLRVSIGSEHGLQPLSECSVVVAPYDVEGEPMGTIGVLGPTRMDYAQAMATVAVVSQRLGRRLSEG